MKLSEWKLYSIYALGHILQGSPEADKKYLKILFKYLMGKECNFDNPQTYSEKLQWLKIYDRNPLYTQLVDKYEVRKFIEERIGSEHLIPCLGVYLFSSVLEPKLNPMDYRYVLDDKLLLPLFCVGVEHVRTPRTYYSVCDGICFDEEKNIVDELWPDLQKCLAQFSPIRPDGGAGRRSCAESSDLLQREEREEVSARRGVRLCPVGQPEGHRTFY